MLLDIMNARSTGKFFRQLGIQALGEECGSGENLSHYIEHKHAWTQKPILFLCGSKRRDFIPNGFRKSKQPYRELCIYRTNLIAEIELPVRCVYPFWIIFFSPSGVQALSQSKSGRVKLAENIAIGESTREALETIAHCSDDSYAPPTGSAHGDSCGDTSRR